MKRLLAYDQMTRCSSNPALHVLVVGLLLQGCGRDPESEFKNLAASKEQALTQLLNKQTQGEKSSCQDFRSMSNGDRSEIEFVHYSEVDGSSMGLGMLRAEIGWKVQYALRDGEWKYVSSERQVWDLKGQPQGWRSADDSRNEDSIAIVQVLR